MYRKLAIKITDFFVSKKTIDETKKAIYQYGFEILISSLFYTLIFLAIAFLTDSFFESIIFWLGLFMIRKTAGGHHASSYKSCHILFALNHVIFVLILKFFSSEYYSYLSSYMLIFCLISVFLFAPVDHKNKPFIKNEYKRYKLFSKLYCIVLLFFVILCFTTSFKSNIYIFSYTIGTFSATVSLLSAKIIRNKERKKKS